MDVASSASCFGCCASFVGMLPAVVACSYKELYSSLRSGPVLGQLVAIVGDRSALSSFWFLHVQNLTMISAIGNFHSFKGKGKTGRKKGNEK
jgi:hypothetical protein